MAASNVLRDFIKKNFVSIKKVNPSTPILVRECSGIPPKIWARYEFGEEASVLVSDKTSDQVLKHIEELSLK
ncbi:NDUFA2 [Bugula neritina]|uniref:NADH dehydrogenase [ubiquinone] 1 alpha subcomplex subunit 2 n=1 Tax=Bugula neritina TaxID=10212 RepID=A0A7J7K8J1_BUGNE|nr:NDUFA2 [Bugula neritina]